ncbi:DUF4342 domain-containing protein [Scrofimicrobium canadense]|nr:DUF4342 domain-containing protein [Scrofimicrobium canadense]
MTEDAQKHTESPKEVEVVHMEDDTEKSETFQIKGEDLLAKVKQLIKEGNVRRIILSHDGKKLLEIPVTAGAVGVTVAAVISPVLVAVGAIAAVVAQVEVTVVRD